MENRIATAHYELMCIEDMCYVKGEVQRAKKSFEFWKKRWKDVRTGEAGKVFEAYRKSKEDENQILVVRKMGNAKKFVDVLKENGINEFVFTYDFADGILKLAELCEAGCKVVGKEVVNGEKKIFGEREKVVGVLVTL